MKESTYKSYDELPLFLNAETVAKVLGVAPSTVYELMHEADFPTLKIGNRMVVPKEQFIAWWHHHTEGGFSEASEVAKERPNQKLFSGSKRSVPAWSVTGRAGSVFLPAFLRGQKHLSVLAQFQNHWEGHWNEH